MNAELGKSALDEFALSYSESLLCCEPASQLYEPSQLNILQTRAHSLGPYVTTESPRKIFYDEGPLSDGG